MKRSAGSVDLKVVLLGRANVGKSSLVERFINDQFHEVSASVGAAFASRAIPISSSQSLVIGVWDTAGSERYESMTRHYYKGAEGALVCYDTVDRESWDKVKFWVSEIHSAEENCIIAIVGCKSDCIQSKGRAVPKDVVLSYCEDIGAKHYETSALTGQGVAIPFTEIAQQFALKPKKQNASNSVNLGFDDEKRNLSGKGGCC